MLKIIAAWKAIAVIAKDGKVAKVEVPALLNALADLCDGVAEYLAHPASTILKGIADALRLGASIVGQT